LAQYIERMACCSVFSNIITC